MPYISQDKREEITPPINPLLAYIKTAKELKAGDLNYIITLTIKEFYKRNPCYQTINDIVGGLEGAKMEFTRQITNFYEDEKIKINGTVY